MSSAQTTSNVRDIVEQEMKEIANEARLLGAYEGSRRITLVESNLERLSPDNAYQWIDPFAIKQEVLEHQSRQADGLNAIRNTLVLLPLIITWLALSLATINYQQYINANPSKITIPFLKLWQDGFGGRSFNFAETGLLDFLVLVLILCLVVRSDRE